MPVKPKEFESSSTSRPGPRPMYEWMMSLVDCAAYIPDLTSKLLSAGTCFSLKACEHRRPCNPETQFPLTWRGGKEEVEQRAASKPPSRRKNVQHVKIELIRMFFYHVLPVCLGPARPTHSGWRILPARFVGGEHMSVFVGFQWV